jgi:uroporphyrinogen decarboxylase
MNFPVLKNDRFLKALHGERVDRPPVWMMRQAGRYLPEYRELQAKYSFFERCETPELATEITLQPIDRLGVDAAILFSDILVMAQALDFHVTIEKGEGPIIHNPIETVEDAFRVRKPDVVDRLHYVMQAVTMIRTELNGRVPLIGFAGSPWTIFCYLVEGHGSKDFAKAKAFCFSHPIAAAHVLSVIADATADYLNAQIQAGAQAVQVFDSWGGLLSPNDFSLLSYPYMKQIVEQISGAPVILFAKGAWYAMEEMTKSGASALGLDWCTTPEFARKVTKNAITLQGNFDPTHLLKPIPELKAEVHDMINRFGMQRYIVNLGHGIIPGIPVDHAQAFVEAVKEYGG